MKFTIEIQDYEPGSDPDPLTTHRIEVVVTQLLDRDESDGIVIVTKEDS